MRRVKALRMAILLAVAGCGRDSDDGSVPLTIAATDGESPPEVSTGWSAVYSGLELSGMAIPRQGLANPTLKAALGVTAEPYGSLTQQEGHEWVRGKVSWFGGPADFVVGATETGAITGEVLRKLNDPLHPPDSTLLQRPADYYYCAMRWNYSPLGKSWWAKARILVLNPKTGKAVVLRPVDWGPGLTEKRILDLSPQAIKDLGLQTDQEALVAFAPMSTPLGRVNP